MGGLVCAAYRRKNREFPTLKRTLNLGIEKGRLLKNSRPKGGLIQVICYPTSPETVDITGFFEKFCIAIRTKKKDTLKACLSFWVPRAVGPLHPSVIQMLGGSTRKGYATSVRRQSRQRLCGEFRLRRGFACGTTLVRRICAAGQKAGWGVLLYLFEVSCCRNVRFAATSFYTCGKKEVIRPIPAPPLQPRPALRAAFTIEKPSTLTVSPTRRKHSVLSAGFCDILVYNDERSRLWSLTG